MAHPFSAAWLAHAFPPTNAAYIRYMDRAMEVFGRENANAKTENMIEMQREKDAA